MEASQTFRSFAITSVCAVVLAACSGESPAPAPSGALASSASTPPLGDSLAGRCAGRSPTICPTFEWATVVNNGFVVPGDTRKFNSYNQPSINTSRLVAFRARSKGGVTGEPAHGVFTRDMLAKTSVRTVFDRTTPVPQPNNQAATFVEPPSFPRIDMVSSTVASRGNHQPVWEYLLEDGTETRAGTTGIYTNPFGTLITGESNLGAVPSFPFFSVPNRGALKFDVFPGAPAITGAATIVFKGNFTVGGTSMTGVYYRDLADATAGGTSAAVLLADSETTIPGTSTRFGSTAPPSAAGRVAVFAGFDNEDAPTLGGIYLVPLTNAPTLTPLVQIGAPVPGEGGAGFAKLGEGLSFDGRFVAFWGAWGSETKTLVLQCPTEGNQPRVAYCNEQYPSGFTTTVPVHQGVFVHDLKTHLTRAVAKSPADYDDFLYWNFSGLVPGTGESDETGEPARWRSASFVAVSGLVDGSLEDAVFHTAFKARTGDVVSGAYVSPVDGIYLRRGPGRSPFSVVVRTGIDGTTLDPDAVYVDEETGVTTHLPVTEMGVERDGFRGDALAINVSMGTEEAGWAGIYLTTVPEEDR